MVRRDERATRHACEVLHRVLVAVGRAVVHYQGPGTAWKPQASLLLRRWPSRRRRSCPLPSRWWSAEGALMVAVGGVLPRAYRERLVEGVGCSLAVGHLESDLVATCAV